MSILPEQALFARLTTHGPVVNLIAARCYPVKAPQTAVRPYLVYRRISGNPERHMGGASELASARIQIDSIGNEYADARALADAVRMALDGFKGLIGVGTGWLNVRHLSLENDSDDFVDPTAGSDDGIYIAHQDYLIFYILSIPTL